MFKASQQLLRFSFPSLIYQQMQDNWSICCVYEESHGSSYLRFSCFYFLDFFASSEARIFSLRLFSGSVMSRVTLFSLWTLDLSSSSPRVLLVNEGTDTLHSQWRFQNQSTTFLASTSSSYLIIQSEQSLLQGKDSQLWKFLWNLLTNFSLSSVIATAGAITSQKLAGQDFNPKTVFAYTAFGALVAGPFAHYFYEFIGKIVPDVRFRRILEFLLERFTFAPIFCALSLFFLGIFEGKPVDVATANLFKLYKSVLLANWKYLTLPVFLNFNFVPPMLRVFVSNIIGFFWVIFVSDKRRRAAAVAAKKEEK